MRIKTSDLEDNALDYAVAISTDGSKAFFDAFGANSIGRNFSDEVLIGAIRPSIDWRQGGPLIESRIGATQYDDRDLEPFYAETRCSNMGGYANGPTLLIAAMRAIVASELGDEVDVPEELA